MAKAPYKLPNVFVGCPYNKPFSFATFRDTLAKLPFRFYYANTHLQTKHLLGILTNYITVADYCIFDISTWNPNVALELGLADGLGAEYYILINRKLSRGVPADIQGIQRIEYSNYDDYDSEHGLLQQLIRYLVKDQTHPRNIWDSLTADGRDQKFTVALQILSHFRDNARLTNDDLKRVARGSYLRKEPLQGVVDTLQQLGLVSGIHGKGATLRKNLFKEPVRIR